MAARVAAEQFVKSVIAGHNNLHIAEPSGHTGWVTFKAISNGMHSNATIRSDTARFTSRKFRVVRMRGVCEITRHTRVFPVTPQRKIIAKKVYSVTWVPVIEVSVEFVIKMFKEMWLLGNTRKALVFQIKVVNVFSQETISGKSVVPFDVQ